MGAPNAHAYTTNGQMYLFNESDLIISNAAAGLAGTQGHQHHHLVSGPQHPASYLTPVTNDFYALKRPLAPQQHGDTTSGSVNITNVTYAGYSFVTNVSYYDYREADTVQAVQVDVGKLNVWITNTAATGGNQYNRTSYHDNGHGIRSIYVYNKVPKTASQLPAVRLVNGAQLPFTTDPNGTGATTSGLDGHHAAAALCQRRLQRANRRQRRRGIGADDEYRQHLSCRAHWRRHLHPLRQLE